MQAWLRMKAPSLKLITVLLVAIGCAVALRGHLAQWSQGVSGAVVVTPDREAPGHGSESATPGDLPQARSAVSGLAALLSAGDSIGVAADALRLQGQVQSPDGQPVSGARVLVVDWSPRAMVAPPDVASVALASTVTDEEGRFELDAANLPTTLVAWAQHEAFPDARFGPCSAAELQAGVIRFQVGNSFRGRVVNASGVPVGDARVLLIAPTLDGVLELGLAKEEPLEVLVTDADGRFESSRQPDAPIHLLAQGGDAIALARGLRPGTGDVLLQLGPGAKVSGLMVDAQTRAPVVGTLTVPALPGLSVSSDAAGAFELRLPLGDVQSRAQGWEICAHSKTHLESERLVLTDEANLVWALDSRPRLRGRAWLPDGTPAVGAWLELSDPAVDAEADGLPFVVDAMGQFEWYLPRELENERLRMRHASDAHAAIGPLDLASGERSKSLDVHLSESGQLAGRVRDAHGQALADVVVEAFDQGQSSLALLSAKPDQRGVSDAAGSFELPLNRERSWMLRFSRSGFRSEVIEIPPDHRSQLAVVLRSGGVLSGRVVDEEGAPVADAEVVRIDKLGLASTRSSATGDFRFEGVSGVAQALACETGEHVPFLERELWPDQGEVLIQLRRGAFVRGNVFDSESAAPLTSFSITRVRTDVDADQLDQLIAELALPYSSEDGSFELGPLAAGRYLLRIEVPGFRPWESPELAIGRNHGVDGLSVPMERGLTFEGLVLDSEGEPLASSEVRLYSLTDPSSALQMRQEAQSGMKLRLAATFKTNSRGRYRRRGLASGSYRVVIEADGCVGLSTDVELTAAVSEHEFQLAPALTVSGTAWYGDGTPAGSVTVFTQGDSEVAGGRFFISARTSANGAFELEGLDPGHSYRIVANARDPETGDYRVGMQTVELGNAPLRDVTMIIQ